MLSQRRRAQQSTILAGSGRATGVGISSLAVVAACLVSASSSSTAEWPAPIFLGAQATVSNYCPTSWPQGTVEIAADGAQGVTSYEASGCVIGTNATSPARLTIDMSNAPTTATGSIAVSFTNGRAYPLSLLTFVCPTQDNSAKGKPFVITVKNNAFQANGGFRLGGSLPPSSVLTVEGNTFELAAPSTSAIMPGWFVDGFTAIGLDVTIAQPNGALIGAGSKIVISSNIVQGTGDLQSTFSTIGISWRGSATYGAGASVEISNNQFTMSCAGPLYPLSDQQTCVIGIHFLANQYFDASATFLVEDNKFNIGNGGTIAALPPMDFDSVGSYVSFSRNTGTVNTTNAVGTTFLSFGTITSTTSADGLFVIAGNSFDIVGTKVCAVNFGLAIPVFQTFGQPPSDIPADISGSVMISMARNTFSAAGCLPYFLMTRVHTMANSAALAITANTFSRTDAGTSAYAGVDLQAAVTLSNGATISVSGNTYSQGGDAGAVPERSFLIGSLVSVQPTITGPADSFKACDNTYFGATLDTLDAVKAACSASVASIVASTDCLPIVDSSTLPSTTDAANTGETGQSATDPPISGQTTLTTVVSPTTTPAPTTFPGTSPLPTAVDPTPGPISSGTTTHPVVTDPASTSVVTDPTVLPPNPTTQQSPVSSQETTMPAVPTDPTGGATDPPPPTPKPSTETTMPAVPTDPTGGATDPTFPPQTTTTKPNGAPPLVSSRLVFTAATALALGISTLL